MISLNNTGIINYVDSKRLGFLTEDSISVAV